MKQRSLFFRLFLGNFLIVAVVVAVAALVSYRGLSAEFVEAAGAYEDYLARIAQQYIEHVWPAPDAEIDRICKQFDQELPHGDAGRPRGAEAELPLRLTVIALDGRVLGDSRSDPAAMQNHRTPDRPEVLAALEGQAGRDVRHSETLSTEFRYVAEPIRHGGEVVGAVRVAMPVVAILESQAVMREALFWASVAAVAAFALLGLLANWIWYAPLKEATRAARRIAAGDLSHRARIAGPAELAQLGSALNAMRDSLSAQIATITAQRENLGHVVANMREGVIALDAAGRIVLMNRAAATLLVVGEQEVTGRYFQNVVRAAGIVDAYNRAVASHRPVDRSMEIDLPSGRRHLDVHAAPTAGGSAAEISALVVVRDVTDLVRTAAMKAEFVANASHELRTPLATIRAAVDSLASVDPGDQEAVKKFVEILDRHLHRLEDMTLDLLNLHVLESASREPARETIPVATIVQWARAHFTGRAEHKGVRLEFLPAGPEDSFVSDRPLVELILQNLLDNAIKFTPAGGGVVCSIERQGEAVCLRVADTGCGIRREDQPHVFERFYQADASRSGDSAIRGTGLGLSIVKHACERLGATVRLESELGKGTTMTVVIPDCGHSV